MDKNLKIIYNLSKILLLVTPIIIFLYVSLISVRESSSIQDIVQKDPRFSVLILVCVINLFKVYILTFIEKWIKENRILSSLINLLIFMVIQIFLQNLLYTILFFIIIFKICKLNKISLRDFSNIGKEQRIFSRLCCSFLLLFLSIICLFANVRIQGII